MNVLLVEDEAGIREGLAAFLRLKGHVVRVAASCAAGAQLAADEDFDVVVTDWRLGDGLGAAVLAACRCPAVVMTGYPEEIATAARGAAVLHKPVSPAALIAEIERHAPAAAAGDRFQALLDALPCDTRDRIALACALAGGRAGARLLDDGECVLLRVPLTAADDEALEQLELLGGDLRVLAAAGAPRIELRLYRDGRPDADPAVRFGDPLPAAPAPLVVDLDGAGGCDPRAVVALVDQLAAHARRGRDVRLLNLPSHLRLHLEVSGKDDLLPKRAKSGPRLPEVLLELWRQE